MGRHERPSGTSVSESTTETEPTFVKIPLWLLHREDISSTSKLVYGRLVLYAGKNGKCWPSQATLASQVGIKRRNLFNCLAELRDAGLIDWGKSKLSNRYVISDWQKTAHRTGRKLPVSVAENCHQKEVLKEDGKYVIARSSSTTDKIAGPKPKANTGYAEMHWYAQ